MDGRRLTALALALAFVVLVCVGCAPGTERFEVSQAGFWAGLWHGIIIVITFVISLFSDTVRMYEPNNVGALYDLGFLFGAIISLGGCARSQCRKRKLVKVLDDRECKDVEAKVKAGIQKWLEESEQSEGDWGEIARKVEEKIKRELRDWAEE